MRALKCCVRIAQDQLMPDRLPSGCITTCLLDRQARGPSTCPLPAVGCKWWSRSASPRGCEPSLLTTSGQCVCLSACEHTPNSFSSSTAVLSLSASLCLLTQPVMEALPVPSSSLVGWQNSEWVPPIVLRPCFPLLIHAHKRLSWTTRMALQLLLDICFAKRSCCCLSFSHWH